MTSAIASAPTGAPRQFPHRWRLSRAGIVNVWHYLENTFDLSGGRMILRGSNGSGKSRALEMLLPFLLDGDRRKMDATGSGRVNLDELMRTGSQDQKNRTGYLWLELERPDHEFLTVGALIKHSRSSNRTQVWYFTTPLRVDHELQLLSPHRETLAREKLTELIGAEQITESADGHRDRIRKSVFGLEGDVGRDRYQGLLQLLHTLRSPDVGNRIDEGRLPQILSDSLPPLSEVTLAQAGEKLDGLTATRERQQRLEESLERVTAFLKVYRRYAAVTVLETADTTLASVEAVAAAEQDAADKVAEHDRLRQELSAACTDEQRHRADLTELQNAINGIRARDVFRQADDLAQRDRVVATLATAATQAFAAAERSRRGHAGSIAQADGRFHELRRSVDDAADTLGAARRALHDAVLPDASLPSEIRSTEWARETITEIIRVDLAGEPQPVQRATPRKVELWPTEPGGADPGIRAAADAAARRRDLAQTRLQEAKRLARQEAAVREAEADAARAEERASSDKQQADGDADRRDEQAVALAQAWESWTSAPDTADLLADVDWSASSDLAQLLADVDALSGPGNPGPDLAGLDAAAQVHARAARDTVTTARNRLEALTAADTETRADLTAEKAALVNERDPLPADPPWLRADRPGVPLWRTVDFVDELPSADRAGIEGALLAAGLLTATIEPDGSVRAEDGSVLLIGGGAPAQRPLTLALKPDPSGQVAVDTVRAVLSAIALEGRIITDGSVGSATTAVSSDGSWRNGPLRGRHVTSSARHIGAAAREQARRVRLAEIEDLLQALDARQEQRATERRGLLERNRRLDQHVAGAPRSAELHAARRVAQEAADRAERSRATAVQAVVRARDGRTVWARELEAHRSLCAHHGVPVDADGLAGVITAAVAATQKCRQLQERLGRVVDGAAQHVASLALVDVAALERDEAEQRAQSCWREWSDLAAEVAALHEAIGLDVQQAREELARSEGAFRETQALVAEVSRRVGQLGPLEGEAIAVVRQAHVEVEQRRADMIAAAQRFSRRVMLPGLAAAAAGDHTIEPIDRPELPDTVRAITQAARKAIVRPAQAASASTVSAAFQTFDRELSGQLDVRLVMEEDVVVISVVGAGDDRTVAGAAVHLEESVVRGRAALSDREREVFTTFVLGGVSDELRRRINQATGLVAAMNESLGKIRTSNGIGVRLTWHLTDHAPNLRRIAQLIATADAVRSPAQNDELTGLLRARVEEFYASDPSSGYAAHLSAALDYRAWHEVEAIILGPDPGQERPLSKRAKLSQGETRFVSYVTLFAAADGYLSGLSADNGQLRLILLDDAFAKVDDPTIAELMGLLVRLDLDFVMTGHSLWGCFPQVPQLDIYEVRRQEGTSAVTTHVHWDGRNRHLRSTA
ncbi:MAG: hypothetical protein JWM76_2835 [Pseudonocardiales bacterium]|nr:hypothetical protein [Pseudonocardiales bacterium]